MPRYYIGKSSNLLDLAYFSNNIKHIEVQLIPM